MVMLPVKAMVFGEQFPAAESDSLAAVLPEALLDSVPASWCRESQAVPAVLLDRWARALVAAWSAAFAPVRHWLQRTQRMPELPASLNYAISN